MNLRMRKMRVARYYNNSDVRLEEIERPEITDNEILVKVIASGICGSDVMEWYRIKKAPLVLGHEITGEISKVGRNVKDYREGDRVFVSHHVPCNKCHYCLNDKHTMCNLLHHTNFYPGGFSEYIKVPEINVDRGVFSLPDEVAFDEGVLIEPLACVVRGQRIANLKQGQSVLVIGSGVSGLLNIKLARATGTGNIFATDINEYKLNAAKNSGADFVFNAKDDIVKKINEIQGRGTDTVIICTGAAEAFSQALKAVDLGGTILLFAPTNPNININFNPNEFWNKGITLTTTYAASPKDIVVAIELIKKKIISVKEMITHKFGLAETGIGFKLVAEAKDSIKVIIEPQR